MAAVHIGEWKDWKVMQERMFLTKKVKLEGKFQYTCMNKLQTPHLLAYLGAVLQGNLESTK